MMKIGIVTPTFHPYPGGVTEHVFHTFREMSRLGHDVKIVTTSFGGGDSPIEDRVIRIGRAVPIPANGSICPVAVDPRMTASVRRVLDRERFDVIHVHEPLMPMLCLAVLAAARAPVVGTFHASNESSLGYRIWRPVLMRYYERLAARIAVSDAARASVQPFFGGEFRIIPNGVDVARFALAEPLPDLKDGSYNILFVGRLEPRKGAKYLFRAMPDILKEIPEARLTVIGGGLLAGYYRGFVPAEARERVRFLGRVPGEVLARHYATADVYCSPATGGESFGIVLLEAMAAGAAVVASDIQVRHPGRRDRHPYEATLAGVARPGDRRLAARRGAEVAHRRRCGRGGSPLLVGQGDGRDPRGSDERRFAAAGKWSSDGGPLRRLQKS